MSTDLERSRIRDNQRRSRAKKKEYLQELEQRLRSTQLQGVEASTEVQQAARAVAEENTKLRELLKLVGINGDFIDRYIQTGQLGSTPDASFRAVHEQGSTGSAVQALESLLGPRRPSGLDPNAPFSPLARRQSSDLSVSSASTSSSTWDGLSTTTDHPPHPTWAMEPAAMGGNISSDPFVPSMSMTSGRITTHGQPPPHWGPPPISSSSTSLSNPHPVYGINQYAGLQPPLEAIPPPPTQSSQLDDRSRHTSSAGYGHHQATLAYLPPSSMSPRSGPIEPMPMASAPFRPSGSSPHHQAWPQ